MVDRKRLININSFLVRVVNILRNINQVSNHIKNIKNAMKNKTINVTITDTIFLDKENKRLNA